MRVVWMESLLFQKKQIKLQINYFYRRDYETDSNYIDYYTKFIDANHAKTPSD
jgi:hypothetical protein